MDLDTITLPKGITEIGEFAFDNTGYYREKSNWEENVLYIGTYLISGKYNDAYFRDDWKGNSPYVSDVRQLYRTKTGMATGEYTIKPGTTLIVGGTFQYCGITEITIPDSVKKIGANAFRKTKLEGVVIPEGIKTIESYTFGECESLKSVTVPKSVTKIGDRALGYNYGRKKAELCDGF